MMIPLLLYLTNVAIQQLVLYQRVYIAYFESLLLLLLRHRIQTCQTLLFDLFHLEIVDAHVV